MGQEIKKSPGQKTHEIKLNQIKSISQFFFEQIPFFAISKMGKNQFLNWAKSALNAISQK